MKLYLSSIGAPNVQALHELLDKTSNVKVASYWMKKCDFKSVVQKPLKQGVVYGDESAGTVAVCPKDHGMTDRDVFPFDNVSYFTDCGKFSKDFGWSPEVSLVEGLTTTYSEWLSSSHRLPTNYEKEDAVLELNSESKS
jgi:hypothetical protein